MSRVPITFNFVEHIDFNKIGDLKVVGRGTFGVVYRGRWHDEWVAVKKIQSREDAKAIEMEIKHLSRVSHPNIIKLYGNCVDPVCLVMEYAEFGSLHKLLHGLAIEVGEVEYKRCHALSWALQAARGVAYLHDMRPKAIIHRDLKPANLLLFDGGTVLKICDFGLARDKASMMTNGQGSASWMAPEVIEGVNYSEKCDVFSWGITLWEVCTREKPFNEVGDTAASIMWAIHKGKRPSLQMPVLQSYKPEVLRLMTLCWDQNPNVRPSMAKVVENMEYYSQELPASVERIKYPPSSAPPQLQQITITPGKQRFQELRAKFQ